MMTYKLEITAEQLRIISTGMELLARLGIGQVERAFDHLPLNRSQIHDWPEDMILVRKIISKYTIGNVDGYRSSLGILNEKTSAQAKIAWDMHQVFRHQLSWDDAVERGIVESEISDRKFPEMITVDFNTPSPVCDYPLAKVLEK